MRINGIRSLIRNSKRLIVVLFTPKKGKLPDFLIIGSMKCGTTSLVKYLSAHPKVFIAKIVFGSEFHFFDSYKYYFGTNFYKSFFTQTDKVQGEKTPKYIFKLACHAKMFKTLPKAKLILILRNPIDRAYSQWNHHNYFKNRRDWTITSFEEALSFEPELIERGKYIDQIEHLLRYYPREQLHIIILERFKKNIQRGCDELFTFLDLPAYKILDESPDNVIPYTKPMQAITREKLKASFAPFNERLFTLLGFRISEWE